MRAESYAFIAEFFLAGDAGGAIPRTGSQDDRLCLQLDVASELNNKEVAFLAQALRLQGLHKVDPIGYHVLAQLGSKIATLGLRNGNQVFNASSIVYLPTYSPGSDSDVEALARRINSRRGTGRACSNYQHIERFLLIELVGSARGRTCIQLCHNLGHGHTPLAK